MLFHLLPVAIWLLAIGGSVVWFLLSEDFHFSAFLQAFLPAIIALICILFVTSVKRHASSVEECFVVAVLLGVAAYWLFGIVFLIIPLLGYLYVHHLLELRSIAAALVGFALVAIWAYMLTQFSIIDYTFSLTKNAEGWIPSGAFLFAYLAATIARRILRVR